MLDRCLFSCGSFRLKHRETCVLIFKLVNLVMFFFSLLWLISAIYIAKDKIFSLHENIWIRERAIVLGVIFTFIVFIIGLLGLCLTKH